MAEPIKLPADEFWQQMKQPRIQLDDKDHFDLSKDGDRAAFGRWLRERPAGMDDNDQERAQQFQEHWARVTQAAKEEVDRQLHGPRKPGQP